MSQPVLPFDVETTRPVSDRARHPRGPETSALAPAHASDQFSPHYSPVFVQHPRARRYVVRVKADGTVRVTIPRRGSKREAAAFAEQQREWIEKQRRRVAEKRAAAPPAPEMSVEEQRALRARAERELPVRLHVLAAGFGLNVARITVKNQRWRWGSCSRRGHICLNWRLVAMPGWVRDYVLIHELMHLKRMDHSEKFWALVAAACPTFEQARSWLRTHQDLLALSNPSHP